MYNNSLPANMVEAYVSLQNRLKKENKGYKRVIYSKELRLGYLILELKNTLFGKQRLGYLKQKIYYSIRWKKLCKRYPIIHEEEQISTKESNYFSNEHIVIYTAIFGKYDIPKTPVVVPDNCDFYLITDQEDLVVSTWKTIRASELIPDYDKLSNAERNRFCKMFPYKIFKDVRFSVYIDGNIKPITDLTEFVNHDYKYGLQFHAHKARRCVYDEIEACRILKKSPINALNEYRSKLLNSGFPKKYGMVECNVIVRDHNNEEMKGIMEEWWEEFHRNEVKRDQLSIPYLLWKHGIRIDEVSHLGNNVEENDAIRVVNHA